MSLEKIFYLNLTSSQQRPVLDDKKHAKACKVLNKLVSCIIAQIDILSLFFVQKAGDGLINFMADLQLQDTYY